MSPSIIANDENNTNNNGHKTTNAKVCKGWSKYYDLVLFQGFWCPSLLIPNVKSFQSKYQSHEDDIFLTSLPKTGTTWLKALVYSIVNRKRYSISDTPLLTTSPHELVPFVELNRVSFGSVLGMLKENRWAIFRGATFSSIVNLIRPRADPAVGERGGRLWGTHLPYHALPASVNASTCRVVYICRNPLDTIVSGWHFGVDFREDYRKRWTLEDYVEKFCEGEAHMFGPYWSHVLGYWKESVEKPDKVLFLKYEEMKEDTFGQVKRIAEFLGFRFSEEEVKCGVVEEIVELCSLKSLKSLDVNSKGELFPMYENKSFFRKGNVGDWANLLTPAMAKRINEVVEEKLRGSGLTFKTSI